MPRQKPRHLPTAEANFKCCFGVDMFSNIWNVTTEYQTNFIFTKIFELYQVTRYSERFQVTKCSNTSILYMLKALLSKIDSIFFFSSPDMQKYHNLLGCYAIGINSSCNLSALHFSNLICLTEKLSWLDWKLKWHVWQKSFFKQLIKRTVFF